MLTSFSQAVAEHVSVVQGLETCRAVIEQGRAAIVAALTSGGKVLLCGNGGSAADCQHIAAEMVVRYQKIRRPLAAIALTTDTSILTAHSNDFDFSSVFSRQVEALGRKGDCLIALSTSGNSPNVVEAASVARRQGVVVIGMTGGNGGALSGLADHAIIVPCDVTARIQEAHILIAHWWCQSLEDL